MEAGLDRPDGDAERCCRLRQRKCEEEAKDDHSTLLGLELRERMIEKVAIRDHRRGVGDGRMVEGCELHLDDAAASPSGLVEAGIHGESVEPGPEPVRVAQPGQVPPGSDHRILDGVARELRVPEDEPGSRIQAREGGVHERDEGVMIASLRSLDESSLVHGHPFGGVTRLVALTRVGVPGSAKVPGQRASESRPRRVELVDAALAFEGHGSCGAAAADGDPHGFSECGCTIGPTSPGRTR